MRVCRKCSKQADDNSKICRDCGAILEDVPDDPAPPPHPPEPLEPVAEEDSEQSSPHANLAERRFEPLNDTGSQLLLSGGPANKWKCPQCGETVPGTFDVCWKCLTAKDGEPAEEGLLEYLEAISNQNKDPVGEPSDPVAEAVALDEDDESDDRDDNPPSVDACPRCGSSKIMCGITVQDQGQYSDGQLRVVVFGDPAALLFKDRLYGDLKAQICGACGFVEFRVANARELYRHYRNARSSSSQ